MSKITETVAAIIARCDAFAESKHPRDKDGKFGVGGTREHVTPAEQEARESQWNKDKLAEFEKEGEEDARAGKGLSMLRQFGAPYREAYRRGFRRAKLDSVLAKCDAFDEKKHKRDHSGKFDIVNRGGYMGRDYDPEASKPREQRVLEHTLAYWKNELHMAEGAQRERNNRATEDRVFEVREHLHTAKQRLEKYMKKGSRRK